MHRNHQYKSLQPERIIETVEALYMRLSHRFPNSGLRNLCEELLTVSQRARERAHEIQTPLVGLRILSGCLIVAILVVMVLMARETLKNQPGDLTFPDFIQTLEAGINDLLLVGAAIFFLVTLETRSKRKRALEALHELRSFAHIIDMHQLTKDPVCVAREGKIASTARDRNMQPFELSRYLDYCSEMLAICGKLAALYVQEFEDSVAVAGVNEIEDLTNGLSRKIWQKMMILQSHMDVMAVNPTHAESLVSATPEVPTAESGCD